MLKNFNSKIPAYLANRLLLLSATSQRLICDRRL